ncbi:ATP-binding protein [Pseudomonas lactis]|uniref:DNA/RNA helicase domain-containing protein n=1 Tax=Pseudomonas lactis TaxID=1615674 RepID=UPI001295C5C4|nr:DNA/RNA helicase domain-containing protein [Pseudomonas lactis]MQB14724.1 ATP-binding protein [Pseudomonas lactis]
MKSINIISLAQAYTSLDPVEYNAYIKHYGIDINNNEVEDLKSFISNMYKTLPFVNIFDAFFVSYKIQHISKEFDLLRFGDNYILNVELKNSSTEAKIKTQLIRNKYYLSHINKVVHNFSFVANTNILYKLDSKNDLETVDFDLLTQLLTNQNLLKIDNPDELFNPSDYLVSPFNSTEKFINNQYFLTGQQETIKDKILKIINKGVSDFISINGGPGTGKTLLIYDIVKWTKDQKRTLIVHCGNLNEGHIKLRRLSWNVIPIKSFRNYDLNSLDFIVIDEAQRMYAAQFDKLIVDATASNAICIFSHDKQQTLSSTETRADIEGKINAVAGISKFKLSDKIRTNKEISSFIKLLFNNQRSDVAFSNCGNVNFNYFTDLTTVKNYIQLISNDGWEVLRLTPSLHSPEHHESYSDVYSKNSHAVIGQEFDNVAVVMDQYFSYDDSGSLTYQSRTYYDSVKMLFQNITRTRKRLKLIIIGNKQVLNRCLSILD